MSNPWDNEPTPLTDAESDHVANLHNAYACDRLHDDDVLRASVWREKEERAMRYLIISV